MKKQKILISLLSIICLVGCASNKPAASSSNGGNSSSDVSPTGFDNKFAITDFGTAKFEAEKFDYTNWYPFTGDEVVQESKASGGAYLAAAETGSTAVFYFSVQAYSRVVFSAAYAQIEEDLNVAIDLSKTFAYHVENISDLKLGETKTLKTRTSATNWELISYAEESLYEGEYKVTLEVLSDAENVPSIDYIQFKTSDASVTPVDPSTITEVPDNDMRNLQQYKFLQEEDLTKYKTYATGADLSAPEGIKLRFDDVDTASKYYVQVALSEAELDAAPIREATEKVYKFQNALLGTKYYFRAATSEAGLASAAVKNITTTDVAPRVVYVPDVLNFRDIGGWDSDLVPNGKIKQGLYFRCAQLNMASSGGGSTKSQLDSAGKGLAAIKELGIKVDIDMRDSYNVPSKSPADTTDWPVSLVKASVPSGSEPVRWEGGTYSGTNIANQYKTIFDALAQCDEKPALLHCTFGADRTGIVSFFLEALLGMSEYDMTRDYVWTQFTQGRTVKLTESDAEFPQWISKTKNCEGSTFADKMKTHLMEFGIAESTLEHIREIFVPGYVAKA